jgi:PAS domain-containing protein
MSFSNAVFALVLINSNRLRRLEWTATKAQQAANQELSQGRDMFQKILRAVPTPLFITAKGSGEVIQANDAACEYLGTDLVNGSLHLRDHIDHRDWAKLIQKLQSEGQVAGFETRIRLRDGSIRDVLLFPTMKPRAL